MARRTYTGKQIGVAALIGIMALVLAACGGGGAATPTAGAGIPPTIDPAATLVVTSAVPTAVAMVNEVLPTNSLILTQLSRPLAQLPDGRVVTLSEDRFGAQGSPDGRYGVRTTLINSTFTLELVDYSDGQGGTVTAIPEGANFYGPGITWKADSSGFAFFDFPPPGGANRTTSKTIFYFDVASKQTRRLIPDLKTPGKIAASFAFAPNGSLLLYVVGDANAEGIGGPDSQPVVLDLATSQSTSISTESFLGFSQWLPDSSGFVTLKFDDTGASGVYLYKLNDTGSPKRLTPTTDSDFLVDVSPDGKFIATTSVGTSGNVVNVYRMGIDGGGRTQLTSFEDPQQTITGLVWGVDGVYYSLTGGDGEDTIWRVDLDGRNPTQVATGTLYRIVGVG
ncbi:MAG TPA: hypothetical protein PLD47_01730 [Aggregatilineales bacterium]|nr:hypothetical protein [Anaerolineales bacterium]HRE46419.1 hypothetical protein [Aggregatilineales bacterium]